MEGSIILGEFDGGGLCRAIYSGTIALQEFGLGKISGIWPWENFMAENIQGGLFKGNWLRAKLRKTIVLDGVSWETLDPGRISWVAVVWGVVVQGEITQRKMSGGQKYSGQLPWGISLGATFRVVTVQGGLFRGNCPEAKAQRPIILGRIVWGAVIQGGYSGVIVRGVIDLGKLSYGPIVLGQLSRGGLLEDNCPRGKSLEGNCPGGNFIAGNCPRAVVQGKMSGYRNLRFHNGRRNMFLNTGGINSFLLFLLTLPKHVHMNWKFQGTTKSNISFILKYIFIYWTYFIQAVGVPLSLCERKNFELAWTQSF